MDIRKMMQQLASDPNLMENLEKEVLKAQQNMIKKHENEVVTANSGAGMVVAHVNLVGSLVNLELDDDLLKQNKDAVIELVIAAVNAAQSKAKQKAAADLSSLQQQFGAGFGNES